MRKQSELWRINAQGGLEFGLRRSLAKQRPDSAWEHPAAALAVMCLCATLDFVMFKQLFGSFLHENPLIQYFSIIGCIVGMDLAPIYLGILLRKRDQGYNVSKLLMALLLAAFGVALLANVLLRIHMRDLALPPETSATEFSFGAVVEETSNPGALPYAIFAGALPIVTSLVSFGISYMTSNPLKERLCNLQKEQTAREDAIGQLEALLMEYEEDPDFTVRLVQEDDEQYESALNATRNIGVMYCNYVRERIKEHLGDPSAVNELSKDHRKPLLMLFDTNS